MEWEFIIRLCKKDGSAEREITMMRGTCGCPIVPRQGEFIFVDKAAPYEVIIVNHNYETKKLIVVAVQTA